MECVGTYNVGNERTALPEPTAPESTTQIEYSPNLLASQPPLRRSLHVLEPSGPWAPRARVFRRVPPKPPGRRRNFGTAGLRACWATISLVFRGDPKLRVTQNFNSVSKVNVDSWWPGDPIISSQRSIHSFPSQPPLDLLLPRQPAPGLQLEFFGASIKPVLTHFRSRARNQTKPQQQRNPGKKEGKLLATGTSPRQRPQLLVHYPAQPSPAQLGVGETLANWRAGGDTRPAWPSHCSILRAITNNPPAAKGRIHHLTDFRLQIAFLARLSCETRPTRTLSTTTRRFQRVSIRSGYRNQTPTARSTITINSTLLFPGQPQPISTGRLVPVWLGDNVDKVFFRFDVDDPQVLFGSLLDNKHICGVTSPTTRPPRQILTQHAISILLQARPRDKASDSRHHRDFRI
ncbi:hypothetical protein LZ554_006929 [Drepanopeziza brunnea f. sp. 'monogermtubi']|nr:hypothetical protein LZ554_006929 [Drepanopeziza brunnea f. sp. 'monogermtubi']